MASIQDALIQPEKPLHQAIKTHCFAHNQPLHYSLRAHILFLQHHKVGDSSSHAELEELPSGARPDSGISAGLRTEHLHVKLHVCFFSDVDDVNILFSDFLTLLLRSCRISSAAGLEFQGEAAVPAYAPCQRFGALVRTEWAPFLSFLHQKITAVAANARLAC